jgi:hypothetical protein
MADGRKVRPTAKQIREGEVEVEKDELPQDPTLRASALAEIPEGGEDNRPEPTVSTATGAGGEAYEDDFPEADKLREAGLADKAAARAYVEGGGEFTEIQGIGKAKARAINEALGFEE